MINIKNMGAKEFIKYCNNKEVFVFGAGALTENCVDYVYFENKQVTAIIDNNPSLWNTIKHYQTQEIPVISIQEYIRIINERGIDNAVMLIVPMTFAVDIIDQLNSFSELEGLECYVHAFIRNTREETAPFEFTRGVQKIPKKIHYIWVGGNPLPDEFKRNIETWKKFNPDYEIIRWDESNYDFTWNDYMREAYECKAWGFVSDVSRLDIVYKYGGIYLDADVECVHNLDCLLNDRAFFGMGSGDRINIGVGFGGVKESLIIREMRDFYSTIHFQREDGKMNRTACYFYQHPIFKKYGFKVVSEYQNINGIVVYPPEVMSPIGTSGMGNFYSDKTVSIHYGSGTWLNDSEKDNINKLRNLYLGLTK